MYPDKINCTTTYYIDFESENIYFEGSSFNKEYSYLSLEVRIKNDSNYLNSLKNFLFHLRLPFRDTIYGLSFLRNQISNFYLEIYYMDVFFNISLNEVKPINYIGVIVNKLDLNQKIKNSVGFIRNDLIIDQGYLLANSDIEIQSYLYQSFF